MSIVFATEYAQAYDHLYADKDYERECDVLEQVFATHARRRVQSVLDLGCGTGGHALLLTERGYHVTGVDLSQEMLDLAAEKALARGLEVEWRLGDVRDFELDRRFDAAVMMFAVLGYQWDNADVLATLRNVRRHLSPGGVLALDVWYGPAVLTQRPGERVKVLDTPTGQLLRVARGTLHERMHTCTVSYRLWRMDDATPAVQSREEHTMRYFFPRELELFLEAAGLELVQLGAFDDIDREPTTSDWNVWVVVRAAS